MFLRKPNQYSFLLRNRKYLMSTPKMPKVSICIPTFNSENYLRQAIESALSQNDQDFEIVIVDNCSTDHTGKLVEDLQKRNDGRVHFYKNDHNIGLAGNFNECLKYAQGEYIK
ncbi:MAG: glycosyltransferase family 2 protein, partial [Nitrosomonadales bacterium]